MRKRVFIAIALAIAIGLVALAGFGFTGDSVNAGQSAVRQSNQPAQNQSFSSASIATQSQVQAQQRTGQTETELFMHIGSPVALANGRLLSLDKDSPDLSPVIHRNRTLVPLRVISEHFGADVSYDPTLRQATIETGSNTAVFPVGQQHYFLNGERVALDVETLLISNRSFVPLRVICEDVLGYTVAYEDRLIFIAQETELDDDLVQDVKSRIGMYVRVTDLDALNRYMDGRFNLAPQQAMPVPEDAIALEVPVEADAMDSAGGTDRSPTMSPSAPPAPAPPPDMPDMPDMPMNDPAEPAPPQADEQFEAAPMPNEPQDESMPISDPEVGDFSETNTQVQGIDEGDIIKTDGKYIYIVASSYLKVVEAETMTMAGEYFLGENTQAFEMYFDIGRIVVIGSRSQTQINPPRSIIEDSPDVMPGDIAISPPIYDFDRYSNYTFVTVLDSSDIVDIKPFRYYEVEGGMSTTRKKGDYVYLVSSFSRWYRVYSEDPRPLVSVGDMPEPMPIDKIMIMPGRSGEEFLTISAINIRDASDNITSETIVGSGYVTYMSRDNLYLAIYDGRFYDRQIMNIARFTIDGTRIGYVGSGVIEGSLNDQFSMDEYEGHLRVAASVQRWPDMYNNLYVLDANMDVVGQILGYGEDERIYSARFMGARGYVVTFREIDPLFVFDLSDPRAPRITGELKIPGFSTYLHPVSPTVLLGVGRDVYDIYRTDSRGNQVVVGQNIGGVKISLFDVSDMGRPREIDTLILGDYGYAELLYNHKAAMFRPERSIFGFCGSAGELGAKDFQGAFLISYANDMLSEVGRIEYENPYSGFSVARALLNTGQRLVYIGDTLYYLQDGLLRSFDFSTLAAKATLQLAA